ncbi:hypothetical protein [Bradyrhizobium sp. CCBAU 53421]|uniref:hypothetical protein n=1 Tax=Bradyrhizobium sp. CCBAU 53421 TaxID=1325120 RepID=UPI00188BF6C0|nr:hypothetical protein [Bradyrhizobium sp. CCBAU 53421]QOZ36371.1 hypothetical protein XH92_35890 [Bradyrhizobium sp. CCBAU 53421]
MLCSVVLCLDINTWRQYLSGFAYGIDDSPKVRRHGSLPSRTCGAVVPDVMDLLDVLWLLTRDHLNDPLAIARR